MWNGRSLTLGQNSRRQCLPLRLGKGVAFSRAALLGMARLDRLKLLPWFLYRLPVGWGHRRRIKEALWPPAAHQPMKQRTCSAHLFTTTNTVLRGGGGTGMQPTQNTSDSVIQGLVRFGFAQANHCLGAGLKKHAYWRTPWDHCHPETTRPHLWTDWALKDILQTSTTECNGHRQNQDLLCDWFRGSTNHQSLKDCISDVEWRHFCWYLKRDPKQRNKQSQLAPPFRVSCIQ